MVINPFVNSPEFPRAVTLTTDPASFSRAIAPDPLNPSDRFTSLSSADSFSNGASSRSPSISPAASVQTAAAGSALSIDDPTLTEGNSGISNLTFTVSLSTSSTQTVTVNYATADGTATVGSDYTAASGTLTFNPGETRKTIAVPIMGDLISENTETLFVNLNAPTNATLVIAQGKGVIRESDPTNPTYFTDVRFGAHSHWLQPWRAYSETVPATTLLNGVGMVLDLNYNNTIDPNLVIQMLAKHGIRNARIEIGWANLNYDDETKLSNPTRLRAILEACKQWGVRPLILLNAHQGVPTPLRMFSRTVAEAAPAGSTTLRLNDTRGLVLGRSGLSNLSGYWAAEALITAINGNTVTLSKPLPKAIAAGSNVPMATLKYRPFSVPGSADNTETIAGWQRYVGTIANFVTDALGTANHADKGFDMEIWNELTFGTQFLSINNYYDPDPYTYDQRSIWGELVNATANYATTHPTQFSGVQFGNGFANTIPWPASSSTPERITALNKHPYAGRKTFPKDERVSTKLNALGDPTTFIPNYSALFPEYYGTALQTETLIRDAGPLTSYIAKDAHGRYARKIGDRVVPTEVWVTEVGIPPNSNGITDREAALELKAKTTARYYTFYLNKGVTKLQLFSAARGDLSFGMVQDNFLNYTASNSTYPTDDRPYVSPALQVTGRITAKMQEQLDPNLKTTRPVNLEWIMDTHNHTQFKGDGTGTEANPDLYNRDVFAFLPYQVNSKRFVIPYYVMTRDVTQDLPPEQYTLKVSGLNGNAKSVEVYDPLGDRTIPVTIDRRRENSMELTVTATDYPYLLIINE
ncbi:MAG: hypothetical protein HC866_04335 [Leptolyngbyaceae cyanobacterium RU_5_1]|nr:hypothetical protein [Leptolyngbyaceae cyanobacterium RU_5_1]